MKTTLAHQNNVCNSDKSYRCKIKKRIKRKIKAYVIGSIFTCSLSPLPTFSFSQLEPFVLLPKKNEWEKLYVYSQILFIQPFSRPSITTFFSSSFLFLSSFPFPFSLFCIRSSRSSFTTVFLPYLLTFLEPPFALFLLLLYPLSFFPIPYPFPIFSIPLLQFPLSVCSFPFPFFPFLVSPFLNIFFNNLTLSDEEGRNGDAISDKHERKHANKITVVYLAKHRRIKNGWASENVGEEVGGKDGSGMGGKREEVKREEGGDGMGR